MGNARRSVRILVINRDAGCVFARHGGLSPCWGTLDVHEPAKRSQGADPLDPAQCVTLCRGHHGWVHDHPREAKAMGLLEGRSS